MPHAFSTRRITSPAFLALRTPAVAKANGPFRSLKCAAHARYSSHTSMRRSTPSFDIREVFLSM